MTTSNLRLGRLWVLTISASAALYGCSQTASPEATQSSAPGPESALDASASGQSDGGTSAAGRGGKEATPGPKRLDLEAAAESADGARRQLQVDQPNLGLPADSRFELVMPRMADVRVRLFDESDRVAASNDKLEVGSRTRYLLTPAESLVPGSKYTLVVDGLKAELPTDASGTVFGIARISLSTAGEKPPPPAPPKKKSSRRRNR